ncbi:hypothetical protein MTR_7g013940 [Medicago truncatula]|uniref:Uncharacterized protein n=1 Tax=Medicago truncatula TaxID=3880 RepID=A0A072U730_MEDTR|nr:hypothetical protein MTR_7g013940 [Medicago truncatula]
MVDNYSHHSHIRLSFSYYTSSAINHLISMDEEEEKEGERERKKNWRGGHVFI